MNSIKSGIFGAIVGDALGLPVQFIEREARERDPVTDMRGYGAFDVPEEAGQMTQALSLQQQLD